MGSLLFVSTLLALYGAYLNSEGRWHGFAIWIVTNTVFMIHNYNIGQWQQSLLFLCYLVLSANGLRHSYDDWKD